MWDHSLRLDVLSLAFMNRRYSDKTYESRKFVKKNCLTISSLGRKLNTSVSQDGPFYLYNHQYTRFFIRDACHGARFGANIQEFISSLCTEIKTVHHNLIKSNAQDI